MIFVTAMALEILPLRRHFRHSKMSFKIDKNNEAIAVTNIMNSGLFRFFEVFHFLAFIDTRETFKSLPFSLIKVMPILVCFVSREFLRSFPCFMSYIFANDQRDTCIG